MVADIRNINRLKSISVDEEYLFPTIADVMNSCFGKTWGGYQRSFIPLNDGSGYVVWLPAMAKKRGDVFLPFNKKQGWLNRLSDDGTLLIEEHANDPRTSIIEDEKLPRYVFGHYEDAPYRNGKTQVGEKGGYRFLGVFQMDTENFNFQQGNRIYRKIGDTIDLRRYSGVGNFAYPDLTTINTNETADDNLIDSLRHSSLCEQNDGFRYKEKLQKKRKPVIKEGVSVYPRNRQTAINALAHAHFACEIDNEHPTFVRKNSDKAYTEPHHLIPMAFQDQFDVSLDVEENIVSLCSNCHNQIHYGRAADTLIRMLYAERKAILEKVGIVISLSDILEMYGYSRGR